MVLNPAAWSHYSYAVRDACAMLGRRWSRCTSPTAHARRSSGTTRWSRVAAGVICGLGVDGYRLALEHLAPD